MHRILKNASQPVKRAFLLLFYELDGLYDEYTIAVD